MLHSVVLKDRTTQTELIKRAVALQNEMVTRGARSSLAVKRAADKARIKLIKEIQLMFPDWPEGKPYPNQAKVRLLKSLTEKWKPVDKLLRDEGLNSIQFGVNEAHNTVTRELGFTPETADLAAEFMSEFDLLLKTVQPKDFKVVSDILTTGLIKGEGYFKLSSDLMKAVDITEYKAKRIVRTEMTRAFHGQKMVNYEGAGVERVRHWNPRACNVCDPFHDKVYKLGNNPSVPIHPHCRCTTIPVSEKTKVTG